jgi:anti-sigma B factor antagonist
MNLEFDKHDEQQIVICRVIDSRIDGSVSGDLKKQFEPHLQGGIKRVALDMSAVKFVDSTGLGALISLRKALPEDGELAVCGATAQVDNLFRLTRLNKVLLMCASVDEAIEKLTEIG